WNCGLIKGKLSPPVPPHAPPAAPLCWAATGVLSAGWFETTRPVKSPRSTWLRPYDGAATVSSLLSSSRSGPTSRPRSASPKGPAMPAPATSQDFLELSKKSGILEKQTLDAYLEKLKAESGLPGAPKELALAMIREGLLTPFQADQLLKGKSKGFVINDKYKLLERIGK